MSKEYCQEHMPGMAGDFSLKREFARLKNGEQKTLICEGFGCTGILKENKSCYLLFPDGSKKDVYW